MILSEQSNVFAMLFMWLAEHYSEIILGFRLVLHVVTVWYIVGYVSQERKRFTPTVLAIIIGGCSSAAFMQGMLDWKNLVFNTQPWVMGLVFSLTVICACSKGNMSKPLRFIWR
jgi:uncharacterized membrane protein